MAAYETLPVGAGHCRIVGGQDTTPRKSHGTNLPTPTSLTPALRCWRRCGSRACRIRRTRLNHLPLV